MFDIGWQELFLIGVVTLVVVGPKDLPRVLRTGARFLHKARAMSREFQNGLAEMARERGRDRVVDVLAHRRCRQAVLAAGIGHQLERNAALLQFGHQPGRVREQHVVVGHAVHEQQRRRQPVEPGERCAADVAGPVAGR